MRAALLYEANEPLVIEEIQISKPDRNEVLIRTAASGLCHSDLHFVDGVYPFKPPAVLGHESAGVVEAVGADVRYVEPGDHVITCLTVFCGRCRSCLSGRPSLCGGSGTRRPKGAPPRLSKDGRPVTQFANLGGFAEQMLVHENAVVKIRKDMPLDRAALIGCGVTTGVGAVIRTAGVEAGSDVAIVGCGGVGLSAVNGAALAGANRIIAVDRIGTKLDLARKFGATHTVDASKDDAVAQVHEISGGGVDYAFEAIGRKETAEQAWAMLRAGGVATVIGMLPIGAKIEIPGMDLLTEKRLQGSAMGSTQFRLDMPRFVDFYLAGRLHLDELISRRVSLGDVNDAMAALREGQVARQVFTFD
ncbi:MAG: Zn-dependent alcohol dehydrogenase [Acidimicrobiia bacterium]|nr:Zn-dependent alcohol dehydrogenase [Acidimicrobiia bacterium]